MKRAQTVKLFAVLAIALPGTKPAVANNPLDMNKDTRIALYYSDSSAPSYGIVAVNEKLMEIGVRVSQVPVPSEARPILDASRNRPLTESETGELIQHFRLGRRELLAEIAEAGREPVVHRGGYLQTSEQGVPPYPKVSDMMAVDQEAMVDQQHKFGKLHVNSSEAGVGIDEVMTIVSGGPFTWFFVFEDGSVGKLRFGEIREHDDAWRISYPGLVPHGAFADAQNGLVVAYAHGPKHFVMRYDDEGVVGYQALGENPWIDFSKAKPVLLAEPQAK